LVAPRLALLAVHALLHDRPVAIVDDEEPMQVKLEPVLHGGAVHLRHKAAHPRQPRSIEAEPVTEQLKLLGRAPRVPAAPAADMHPKLRFERSEPALQGADDAGGDPGRVPVHTHHHAERLEPEGMGEPPQQLLRAVVMDNGLTDDGAQPGHARGKPRRDPPAVQRKISAAAWFATAG
jgi:hypothetical protein